MTAIGEGARGIGYRPEIAAELLGARASIDFLEVVAESCFSNRRIRREVQAFAEMWPIVPHGVKLSLGSAAGVDERRLESLAEVARLVRAPFVTEHVALTSAGGCEIGHLTPIPRSREVVDVVARNVSTARAKLPDVPFLLENIAVPFSFPSDDMREEDFYFEITERSGCDLLLDVANLYANAVNAGRDPLEVARAFPLERVEMVHIAGGVFEDGFYFDTHAHAVPDAVLDVLAVVLERAPRVPIVLERDDGFEVGLGFLLQEIQAAEAKRPKEREPRPSAERPRPIAAPSSQAPENLVRDQAELARVLTAAESLDSSVAASIGEEGIERARTILQRKRVEDALPLFESMPSSEDVRALAESVLASTPRAPERSAVADAAAILGAASKEARFADAAAKDLLALRARFLLDGPAPRGRRAPFVARTRLSSGSVIWAVKSFGEAAAVRIYER